MWLQYNDITSKCISSLFRASIFYNIEEDVIDIDQKQSGNDLRPRVEEARAIRS